MASLFVVMLDLVLRAYFHGAILVCHKIFQMSSNLCLPSSVWLASTSRIMHVLSHSELFKHMYYYCEITSSLM